MTLIPKRNLFRPINVEQAAVSMVSAELKINAMNLPEWLYPAVLDDIHAAIIRRQQDGLTVDPTSIEEVSGLVVAAMGDNDHLQTLHKELNRYVVGFMQSDQNSIQQLHNWVDAHPSAINELKGIKE